MKAMFIAELVIDSIPAVMDGMAPAAKQNEHLDILGNWGRGKGTFRTKLTIHMRSRTSKVFAVHEALMLDVKIKTTNYKMKGWESRVSRSDRARLEDEKNRVGVRIERT